MFSFFKLCIKNFGLIHGLTIYLRLKALKRNSIKLPKLEHPIYLRPNTSDLHTFREIFLRDEYALKVPFQPGTIIDVGANIGFTTLYLHRVFPFAKILSLEPDCENFKLLQKNTSAYPTIQALPLALFNRVGEIEMVDEGHGIRGYMAREILGAAKGHVMPCTTVTELMSSQGLVEIDILKIDIEGSELEVFSHEPDTWLPKVKYLIIELHDRMKPGCSKAVFQAISRHNFEFSIKGENLVFVNGDLVRN